jgi:glycosyltransferase involved in cell wall biosynthesis
LQISASYKPAYVYGGPIMSVSKLCEQMVKAGHTVEVLTTTANGVAELPVMPNQSVDIDGVKVTYFKRLTKDHSHFSPALMRMLWRDAKTYDIIHMHAWWNLVSVSSCLIALLRKVPVLVSPRGTLSPYSFNNKNIGAKWIIHNFGGRYLLNRSRTHVTSTREKDAVLKIVHPKSIDTLPNFVKLPVRKPFVEKESASYFKLLFFSRIEEKKGLDILLEALAMITVPFALTIAGDGDPAYIDQLKAIAAKNQVTDKITWAGFYNEDKFDLLYEHDLFILPSYDENFGNAVIESLSVGTPVLISEGVGLADYVKDNNLGWICQTNPSSVGNALNEIIKNQSAELDRIRKQAPEVIYDDFNEDRLAQKYVDMYERLISNEHVN